MRVLVTGGRGYNDRPFLDAVLDQLQARRPISCVIEGGATGADRLARDWAISRGVPFRTFEADWVRYPGVAGRIRNGVMLREGEPDLVLAFQGRSGTRHMVEISQDAGVRTLETYLFA